MRTAKSGSLQDHRSPVDGLQAAMILDGPAIRRITADLANRILDAFKDARTIEALVVLDGARRFAQDLFEAWDDPRFRRHDLKAASYVGTRSTGRVRLDHDLRQGLTGNHLLIIDDIYDSGLTLTELLRIVRSTQPASVRTCVLFEKDRPHEHPVSIDFLGSTVPDRFLVGYGLDLDGQYRELDCVCALEQEDRFLKADGGI